MKGCKVKGWWSSGESLLKWVDDAERAVLRVKLILFWSRKWSQIICIQTGWVWDSTDEGPVARDWIAQRWWHGPRADCRLIDFQQARKQNLGCPHWNNYCHCSHVVSHLWKTSADQTIGRKSVSMSKRRSFKRKIINKRSLTLRLRFLGYIQT